MVYAENTPSMRDNRGRFNKGHEPLIRPKYELMKKYPKILCDNCYMKTDCLDYKNGSVCANKREFKKFINRNINDVIDALCLITDKSIAEMKFYMVQEVINGDYDEKVTKLINKNFKRLLLLYQIYEQIENSNSKSKGIIDKLFSDII